MPLTGSTNAERIWNFCKSKGMNDYGAAGLIGNLDCESGLNPYNLQDTGNQRLGMTDDEYVRAVDSGTYTKDQFIYDEQGAFLAQWTWWTRKKALYEFSKSQGTSIGDLEMQLNFLFKELSESYTSVLQTLKTATSVRQASDIVLLRFECPYMPDPDKTKAIRASYAQKYYDRFSCKATEVNKSMGYIKTTKGSNTKLSEHFTSNEFDCHGTGCCTQTVINEQLVDYLERIRKHFGKSITITSGYRCVKHNQNVGGATGSRHSKGDAADIVVSGVAPKAVAQYAESIGIKGIGLYETSADGHFVHVDTRDVKSFWYGQKCAPRTTFGGATNSATTVTTPESKNYMLTVGSTGNAVRALQEKLVLLEYRIATDGVYGVETRNAVRDYQSKNGLAVDGIAGTLTQKSIDEACAKKEDNTASYQVRVTASALNIRKGAGTNYAITGTIRDKGVYTIVSETTGTGATKWGKLSDGRGWISLDYCMK